MIPCFNQSKYLLNAIQSVLIQTYQNFEVIISDDASSDQTEKYIIKYIRENSLEDKIKYFKNKENLGYLRNYHHTLYQRSSGDWVINLDGDDFFLDKRFFEKIVRLIKLNLDSVMIISNYREFHPSTNKWINISSNLPSKMNTSEFLLKYSQGFVRWNHNTIFYKRDVAKSIGFYWDAELPMNDWESFLRLSCHGSILFNNQFVAAWVQHENNLTPMPDINKYTRNFELIEGLRRYFRSKVIYSKARKKIIPYLIKEFISEPLINILRQRKFLLALRFYFISLKQYPLETLFVTIHPRVIIKMMISFFPNIYNFAKIIKNKS